MSEKLQTKISSLSQTQAAREYLQLLSELGHDFSSPEGQTSRVVNAQGEVLNDAYEGDKLFVRRLLDRAAFTEGSNSSTPSPSIIDFYYDQALCLRMVDSILGAEQERRAAEKMLQKSSQKLRHTIANLENFESINLQNSIIHRLTARRKLKRERERLLAAVDIAQVSVRRETEDAVRAKLFLRDYLEAAYSSDYYCCHHNLSPNQLKDVAYKQKLDDLYSQKFFSPQNLPKIDRAILLRQTFCFY